MSPDFFLFEITIYEILSREILLVLNAYSVTQQPKQSVLVLNENEYVKWNNLKKTRIRTFK